MGKANVFIVEDDPVFIKLLTHQLEQNKINNYKKFESGEACLNEINKKPGLVLLDFSLGGLNGLDVLERIRKESPKTDVVILTGLEDESVKKKCLEAGAAYYINKNPDGLEVLTKNVLPHYKKRSLFSFLN